MTKIDKFWMVSLIQVVSVCLAFTSCEKNQSEDYNGTYDLSSSGTANCYIVYSPYSYKFTPTKGGSSEPVGEIVSVDVLWESFGTDITPSVGDLVKDVKYEDGVIVFKTPRAFKEGNAVIAAKDVNGKILWSWHIWLTDFPKEQPYYQTYFHTDSHINHNEKEFVMDRNLGATSATPGDVGALGLLYQWGRKDPFLGASSISKNILAMSTITWPEPVESDSSTGTIYYATANPTTFISCTRYNDKDNDWCFPSTSATDKARWKKSSEPKSIYDPCPAGWRIPDYDLWSDAFSKTSAISCTFDEDNRGMNFSGKLGPSNNIWYPAAGFRGGHVIVAVGDYGHYWSSLRDTDGAYSLYIASWDCVIPISSNHDMADAMSVRCVKDK